jgi:branched-subunit amino acid transport protein
MSWQELLTVAGMMLVTFGVRYPVLALVSRLTLPEWLRSALRFVPPAVLTAIIVPSLLVNGEYGLWLSPHNAYLVAGLVAIGVALSGRGILITLVTGMVALWGWRWLLPYLPAF